MLAPLRYRDYRLYWIGITVQNTGLWMYRFVFGWLVVDLAIAEGAPERAPLYLGFVGLASAAPPLALTLFAGAIADRADVVRMMALAEVAIGTLSLALGIATLLGLVSVPVVLAVALLLATAYSFESPARVSVLMRLIPADEAMSGMGLYTMSFNGTQVLGPAIGGLLIGPLGVPGLFIVGAIAYFFLAGVLLLVRVRETARMPATSLVRGIVEGIRYVRRDSTILWVLALAAAFSFFARPYLNLLPAYVEGTLHGGATELSQLLTVTGVGSFGGALVLANLGRARRTGVVFILSLAASGASVAVLALQDNFIAAAATALLAGLLTIVCNGVQNVILQTKAEPGMMGRVVSISSLIFFGLIPLGQLAFGALGSAIGIQNAIALGGVAAVAAALLAAGRAVPLWRLVASGTTPPPASRVSTLGEAGD